MDEFFFSMDSAGSVGLTLVPNESRLVPSLPNFLFEKPTLGRRKIRNSSLLTTLSTFCILLSLPFSEEVAGHQSFPGQAFHNKFHSLIFWRSIEGNLFDKKQEGPAPWS